MPLCQQCMPARARLLRGFESIFKMIHLLFKTQAVAVLFQTKKQVNLSFRLKLKEILCNSIECYTLLYRNFELASCVMNRDLI